MIRFILYIVLFYLIYKMVKKFFNILFTPKPEVKGEPRKDINTFNPKDIEDIDYEEVKRSDEEK
ncbi:MAG: hypothetical protein P8184_00200 [Calditrichia bacterium]